MENYRQGDLADVVRASSGTSGSDNWKFPGNWLSYPAAAAAATTTSSIEQACSCDFFGDPSPSSMRDPLLHELDIFPRTQQEAGPDYDNHLHHNEFEYDDDDDAVVMQKKSSDHDASPSMISGGGDDDPDLPTMTQLPPCNIVRNNVSVFSQMLQISTPPPPPAEAAANELMICSSSSRSCLQVADSAGGVQISSPQNPVSKRRKSQAKKVVCIPAPVPANSRPSSGEVVPSDLWAWRKYGQKPIKGSPYPRGYYRCSSSKGCSARKQVERSRTDPNMLVITYTSEHNHPWPTQRNALAGSTRPHQPAAAGSSSKNNNSTAAAASKRQLLGSSSSASGSKKNYNKQVDTSTNRDGTFAGISSVTMTPASTVKLEEMAAAAAAAAAAADVNHNADFGSEWISGEGYRPTLPDSDRSTSDDFFSDLGDIEGDPLSSLLIPGFGEHHNDKYGKPALDPFTLFDWTTGNT